MNAVETLNRRFAACDHLRFSQLADGVVAAEISNSLATATVSLHGGQVLSWHPKHQATPVLWLSTLAKYVPGKAIRGGVPICWPWFGAHPANAGVPAHGYARLCAWEVTAARALASGETQIELDLPASDLSRACQHGALHLSARITVGKALKVELDTTNRSDQEITFSEGLHTYFRIGDIARIRVLGLDGAEYADLLCNNLRKRQTGPIAFEGELGRVYGDTEAACVIEDFSLERRISIQKEGSLSTAVWTPWATTAAKMDDLGANGWRDMVCVESANALANSVTVGAGAGHRMSATYSADDMVPSGGVA